MIAWARESGRLAVINSRLIPSGQRVSHLSLADFCDLVWGEIWNDCPAMGDQGEYRRIMDELFLQGKPPHQIFYETTNKQGKKVRKSLGSAATKSGPLTPPKSALALQADWMNRAKMLQEAGKELTSPSDG